MKITKESIEDAFIHLEDYFNIWSNPYSFRTDNSGEPSRAYLERSSLYDILKGETDIEYFYLYSHIQLSSKSKSLYKFEEWIKINSEISTAIKRIVLDPSSAQILTKNSNYTIDIPLSKQFELENIDKLIDACRKFNNVFSPSMVIFPQFHYEKGIVVYLREILLKDQSRFQVFNEPWLKSGVTVEKFLLENFKFVNKFETEKELLESNEFLNQKVSQLDKFIIYELEPNFNIIR